MYTFLLIFLVTSLVLTGGSPVLVTIISPQSNSNLLSLEKPSLSKLEDINRSLKIDLLSIELETVSRSRKQAIVTGFPKCFMCKTATTLLKIYIKRGYSEGQIKKAIFSYCDVIKIEESGVCQGISEVFGPNIFYILRHLDIESDQICSFILGDDCEDVYSPKHDWDITLPHKPNSDSYEFPLPKKNSSHLKVLQLSDNHYDPFYVEGSNANCDEPLCCRATSGKPLSPRDVAGKWGDYRNCDTPKRTIDHLLKHISDTHKDLDYIIWTGDLPPHDVWIQNREHNLNIIKETIAQMSEHFPGIPIFPALGNHESAPVDAFAPSTIQYKNATMGWLYDELDILWQKWLPESISTTVRRGAFYSILYKPGFRIISLNMNYCNKNNWWLLFNSTDPDNELEWLVDELQKAEKIGEKVHVIGHIPPGTSDCLKVWSKNLYRIVARFESTITAQFYGHTHYDELEIFYDPDNYIRPVGIAYIGPSVTPYVNLNPGYRIYYVDGDHKKTTRTVIDHETWIMDLKEANLKDNPMWYKLYSAKEAYGMKGLRPADWNQIVNQMSSNQTLFDLYYRYYNKNSSYRPDCDKDCKDRIICDSKNGRSHFRKKLCGESNQHYQEEFPEDLISSTYKRVGKLKETVSIIEQEARLATNELDFW